MDTTTSIFCYSGEKDASFLAHFSLAERAYRTACRAHEGQTDKGGRPYIYHPLSVCYILSGISPYDDRLLDDAFFTTPILLEDEEDCDLMATALLHDVLEDTDVTVDVLAGEGFTPQIIDHVLRLTHKKSQRYDYYINSLKGDPQLCRLKIADMLHNSNLKRTKEPTKLLKQWRERYIRGICELWPLLQASGIEHKIQLPDIEEFAGLR
ncbi:MAG: hypothetical protein IJR36_02375 [Lachnospiraceae bacterium]|nr:hypothetical protein [Lachnospiraceae bacterium]MBQ9563727.1 hypothetical protein [Lachnospiraceae bacterium]MBQ9592704.1 hypothetical protein [Lachnospiraceae bacterium]MBR0153562.1 hypothetical protein [Lachnospiraceae bacterium]